MKLSGQPAAIFALLLTANIAASGAQEAYTVPPQIFVGDRASLIVPLRNFPGQGDTEIPVDGLSSRPDIDIYRIAIERRPGGSRLVVEFAAFAPGLLELPEFDAEGILFSGLTVSIASVLDSSLPPILSPPAMPLAVPGTALIVYAAIAGILLFLLLVFVLSLRGRVWLKTAAAALAKRHMLLTMLRAEKRLRRAIAKGMPPREALDCVCAEFRFFLSGFTGENCSAMTAGEIGRLIENLGVFSMQAENTSPGSGFESFFDRCDRMRFSGQNIGTQEAAAVLQDLRDFLLALKRRPQKEAGQENPEQEAAA